LKVEEIPPLALFYGPKHKVMVSRWRKMRRTEQREALVPGSASFQVLWKYSEVTPTEYLGRLLQFARA